MSAKKFTWADLKKMVNKLPPKELKKEITWWGDETGGKITGAAPLEQRNGVRGYCRCNPFPRA